MRLIGLTGLAGAGKDIVGGFVLDWATHHGIQAKRDAFADRLKISAAAALGVPATEAVAFCNALKEPDAALQIDTPYGPAPRISGRKFLQLYGTEAHRDVFGGEFWVNELFKGYDGLFHTQQPDILVLTDVRFENEAEAVRSRGGEIWEVVRDGVEQDTTHVSEDGIDGPDLRFLNYGTREESRVRVYGLCAKRLGFEVSYA